MLDFLCSFWGYWNKLENELDQDFEEKNHVLINLFFIDMWSKQKYCRNHMVHVVIVCFLIWLRVISWISSNAITLSSVCFTFNRLFRFINIFTLCLKIFRGLSMHSRVLNGRNVLIKKHIRMRRKKKTNVIPKKTNNKL